MALLYDHEDVNWIPLERIVGLLPNHHQLLDLSYFMWMCSATTERGVRIDLYKHWLTRRYLNLDGAGHAYKYFIERLPNGRFGDDWYEPHPSLQPALEHLDIYSDFWAGHLQRDG